MVELLVRIFSTGSGMPNDFRHCLRGCWFEFEGLMLKILKAGVLRTWRSPDVEVTEVLDRDVKVTRTD